MKRLWFQIGSMFFVSAACQEIKQRQRAQASAAKEEEQRKAEAKAQEEQRPAVLAAQVSEQNALAQSQRSSRRHGAGAASRSGNNVQVAGKASCEDMEEAEPSKAQIRRERQKTARAAAAKKKAQQRQEMLEEQFRRETAAAFTERTQVLEVIEPEPKVKKSKPREVPLSDNQLATDLQIGLWAAKVAKP